MTIVGLWTAFQAEGSVEEAIQLVQEASASVSGIAADGRRIRLAVEGCEPGALPRVVAGAAADGMRCGLVSAVEDQAAG
ncbi:hypothetical protein [Nonomuraea sp. SYSU D8015]|uniref:hypothetical protein n=1 Tax=Nonomuraea sp. SYSU D8015 TaxID=2593644 RepID=UPI0016613610|nr:hypothetical protein [Nonomuraea sp. SYSU D8015]